MLKIYGKFHQFSWREMRCKLLYFIDTVVKIFYVVNAVFFLASSIHILVVDISITARNVLKSILIDNKIPVQAFTLASK